MNIKKEISISTVTDFTHTESDSVRLGNDEGVTITISSSTKKLTLDDLLIDYDDTLLNVDLVSESTEDKSGTIKLYATGIKECSTEIDVFTFYDLLVKGEDAEGYVVPIKKLNSTEGQPAYVTPTGEKYHLSQECAGENATRITVYEATSYEYKPCKNCAG